MAHHAKCSKGNATGGRMMLDHDKREQYDNRERSNPNIDVGKTHLNQDYSLRDLDAAKSWEWACSYAQEHSSKAMRANAIVMSMDVVHLPKNWEELYPGAPASEFFERVALPFERARYGFNGGENEISAVVHYDETKIDGHEGRPHLHYKYVPITKDGKCSHKIVNCRSDLQTYHSDLVRFARDAGFPGLDLYNEERAQAREAALSMPDYKRAMEIVADAQKYAELETDRLECLRRKNEEVESAIAALEAQPAASSIGENLGTIASSRGIGERERAAAEESERLGSRIEELERDVAEARGKCEGLRGRIEAARSRIEEIAGSLGRTITVRIEESQRRILGILSRHGVAYNATIGSGGTRDKFDDALRRAEEASRAANRARAHRSRPERGIGR